MELPVAWRWLISIPALLWGAYYFLRARQQGRYIAVAYLVVIAYGLLIESQDIRSTHGYDYQQLLFMIGRPPGWVPLSICVSWASIIFIVMTTSDRLGLPWWQRPLVDGLIAVSTDLVGDPVFSNTKFVTTLVQSCADTAGNIVGGIGVWTWCVPTRAPAAWLTVPYDNFVGWFMVVAVMSFGIRFGREKLHAERRSLMQQITLLIITAALSAAAVFAILWVYMRLFNGPTAAPVVFALVLLTALLPLVVQGKRLNLRNRFDLGLVLMPLVSLVSGVVIFFRNGIDKGHWPAWPMLMVGAALASLVLVLLPYLSRLRGESGEDHAGGAAASSGSA